jgi:hypothetical protein
MIDATIGYDSLGSFDFSYGDGMGAINADDAQV